MEEHVVIDLVFCALQFSSTAYEYGGGLGPYWNNMNRTYRTLHMHGVIFIGTYICI